GYFIKCEKVIKNDKGEVVEVHCTYDPATKGGDAPDGRKVKATIHWVSVEQAVKAEVRMYEHLFSVPNPGADEDCDFIDEINPKSMDVLDSCWTEPSLLGAKAGEHYQFERLGYFCVDPDSTDGKPVFNRTVILRDDWAKIQKAQQG